MGYKLPVCTFDLNKYPSIKSEVIDIPAPRVFWEKLSLRWLDSIRAWRFFIANNLRPWKKYICFISLAGNL